MPPGQKDDDRRVTYFAATHTRGKRDMFGIRAADRGKHMYIIGKTGMGKSTMLENMAIQDIQNGEGLAFIDPHGATAERLLDFVPHERIKDVVYFAPFDTDYPIGLNVMEDVGYDKRHLVVSGLMGALKRIWVDAWSARMEYILQNTLLALLEYPDSTLLDVNRMLTNKQFRASVVEKITDPIVRSFWAEEFASFTDTYTREATPAIQNKVGQFTSNPLIRNIVGQAKSSFDLRKIMDEKKIFIVNLSKGRMGETNAALLGSMLVVKIYLAAMSRADEPAARLSKLPRCYFYVDEFQSMMNEAFADILSESRKYKLALTLANQYIEQMEEKVRDAVFGNVGTLVCFRVGPFDAEVLKTIFEPTFTVEDMVGLGIGQIYLTLMIDGVGSRPFSAETIPPIDSPPISYRDDVIRSSREQYSRPRAEMEALVAKRQKDFAPPPKQEKERAALAGAQRTGGRQMDGRRQSAWNAPARERGREQREFHAPPREERSDWRRNEMPRTAPVSPQTPSARSALRTAIASTQPAHAPFSGARHGDTRSPADILREKRATKEERSNPQPASISAPPASKPRNNTSHEERGLPAEAHARQKNIGASDSAQAGEVSPEVLAQVLGRDGDKEST